MNSTVSSVLYNRLWNIVHTAMLIGWMVQSTLLSFLSRLNELGDGTMKWVPSVSMNGWMYMRKIATFLPKRIWKRFNFVPEIIQHFPFTQSRILDINMIFDLLLDFSS